VELLKEKLLIVFEDLLIFLSPLDFTGFTQFPPRDSDPAFCRRSKILCTRTYTAFGERTGVTVGKFLGLEPVQFNLDQQIALEGRENSEADGIFSD